MVNSILKPPQVIESITYVKKADLECYWNNPVLLCTLATYTAGQVWSEPVFDKKKLLVISKAGGNWTKTKVLQWLEKPRFNKIQIPLK